MVVGLPDNGPDADNDVIKSVCAKVGVEGGDVAEVFRDGRAPDFGRPRIVKVKFKNLHSRRKFLSGFRDARSAVAGTAESWARPDLTFRQRIRDRELRGELKRRRDNGEEVVIRRGAIISRNQRAPPP